MGEMRVLGSPQKLANDLFLTGTVTTMTVRTTFWIRTMNWLGMAALLLSGVLLPATTYAQSAPASGAPALQVQSKDGSVHLQWQEGVQAASTGDDSQATIAYGGYLLPIQTVTLQLPADQPAGNAMAAVAVEGMSSTPYAGQL